MREMGLRDILFEEAFNTSTPYTYNDSSNWLQMIGLNQSHGVTSW